MKRIIHDFYKAHISMPVRYVVIFAVCVAAFFMTGIFAREKTLIPGIIVTAFLAAMLIWAVIDVFAAAPADFKNRINRLPEKSAAEVIDGYESAVPLGSRRFYKDTWLLFYAYRRIKLMRYDEIRRADLRRSGILLTLCDGKEAIMPIQSGERGEMVMAALRSKNGSIKFLLDGKPASFTEKASDEENNGEEPQRKG